MIADAETSLGEARAEAAKARLETLLSGEADPNNAYVEINAGAGGTEAQDWAEMLARMYTRWAEQRGYKVSWLEESAGEEAGIKSLRLQGRGAERLWLAEDRNRACTGWCASARSTATRGAIPASPRSGSIPRSTTTSTSRWSTRTCASTPTARSGAGGQHVNKTDSAVRITHIPTGIAVAVQQERSQHQNRAKAMQMLKARLYEVELQKREAERLAIEANKTDIGWGHQIRSYVLQPYQMVKDLRTNVERTDPQKVLDGDLDEFMAATLAARVGEGEGAKAS